MSYWTLESATTETVQLRSDRYAATLMVDRDGATAVDLVRVHKRVRASRPHYLGTLEGRATMHPQSVGRAALNALAREYPAHTLPYVVHALTGGHGAWCADGCTLMVLEGGSVAATG